VGCTTGSKGEIPGERKPVIKGDDDDDDDDDNGIATEGLNYIGSREVQGEKKPVMRDDDNRSKCLCSSNALRLGSVPEEHSYNVGCLRVSIVFLSLYNESTVKYLNGPQLSSSMSLPTHHT